MLLVGAGWPPHHLYILMESTLFSSATAAPGDLVWQPRNNPACGLSITDGLDHLRLHLQLAGVLLLAASIAATHATISLTRLSTPLVTGVCGSWASFLVFSLLGRHRHRELAMCPLALVMPLDYGGKGWGSW